MGKACCENVAGSWETAALGMQMLFFHFLNDYVSDVTKITYR